MAKVVQALHDLRTPSTKSDIQNLKQYVYARVGMLSEAEKELQSVVQRNPGSIPARNLLNLIRSWSRSELSSFFHLGQTSTL